MTPVARRTVLALAGWAALLVAARWVGVLKAEGSAADLKLEAIPLYGRWAWEVGPRLLVPVAFGALAVWVLPRFTLGRWRGLWPVTCVVVGAASVGWSLALAVVDPGRAGFADIEQAYGRYTGLVDEAGGPGAFLSGYVDRQPTYPVHLQAHPPGLPLLLWSLGRLGFTGVGVHVVLAMVGVAVCTVAAVVILREVADEDLARAAAPFVVLVPAAVWHTNADVVFGAVALAGVAFLAAAAGRTHHQTPEYGPFRGLMMRSPGGWVFAVAGGVVLGVSVLLSYGAALFAIPAVAVVAYRRAWGVLVVAGLSAVVTVFAFLGWGFWWFDGLVVTGEQYAAGVAAVRGYAYFLLANPAVFALAIGPAVVAGLVALRDRAAWVVVGSGLAMVAVATLSGLSSGEVERIWQPFVPLVALAGAALVDPSRPKSTRTWLAVQVVVAVVLQAALRSPW